MISPHTKPGTDVVVVETILRAKMLSARGLFVAGDIIGLAARAINDGERHVVEKIIEAGFVSSGFVCAIVGIDAVYPLEFFRYLALPDSITSCLNVARLDAPREMETI